MKLHEYQAKKILAKYGVPLPPGEAISSVDKLEEVVAKIGLPCVIKAQVHVGGRGKAGGIKVAKNSEEAQTKAREILSMKLKGLTVNKILIEKALDIKKEYYLGVVVDRNNRCNTLMLSPVGGVDIEEVAAKQPHKIGRLKIDPQKNLDKSSILKMGEKLKINPKEITKIEKFASALYDAYKKIDASLAEINPLVLTGSGDFIAADAKIIIDDNSLFRQPEYAALKEESEDDHIEAEAHHRGIAYVRLDGDIGIIGNGAGLVMSTMDEVGRAGGRPANFLDIGGGAKADLVKNSLEIVLMDKKVKSIFFNIFGGITRCDEVAKGIIEATQKVNIQVPMVIRLTGTREKEGRALLAKTNLIPVSSMQEGAKKVVELTK